MSDVKRMDLGGGHKSDTEQLKELKGQLVDVLEKINKIRPVQFLDWESEFIYNFIGLMDRPEDDRVFICVSAEYDNLPSHVESPLQMSRGRKTEPVKVDGMV